jgi:hypothetical protein
MKKILTAVSLGLWLFFLIGCSSTPPGTDSIKDLASNPEAKLGKEVVVVGKADTKTALASFRMFKLYGDGENLWIKYPESIEEPPQGVDVRVFGTLRQEEVSIVGMVYFVDANKIVME